MKEDINVLECCHWSYNNYCEAATSDYENHCDENDDCYFKQLKRTEQKLEAFEMESQEALEIIKELKEILKAIEENIMNIKQDNLSDYTKACLKSALRHIEECGKV